MSRLCTSTPDAVLAAVASLSVDDAAPPQAPAAVAAALRDLASGHLAAEAPDRVAPTVAALLPALTTAALADRVDWRATLADPHAPAPDDGLATAAVAFFAAHTAAALARDLRLDCPADAGATSAAPLLGVLAGAAGTLHAAAALLDRAFHAASPRLPDRALADLLFAAVRVAESAALRPARPSDAPNAADAAAGAVAHVRADAHAAASALLARLPALGGRRTPTLAAVVVRAWAPAGAAAGRDGVHRHLSAALRAEDATLGCDDALARLALASAAAVVRALVCLLDAAADLDAVLPAALAAALPVAGDVSPQRRRHAVRAVARCLGRCSRPALQPHGAVLVTALTESLAQGGDDCATTLDAVPALAAAMRLVYPRPSVAGDAPPVWTAALAEMLRTFTAHVARDGPAAGDAHLLAAAAVAAHIPAAAGARLAPHLGPVVSSMSAALVCAGRAVGRRGAPALPCYAAVAAAFGGVLRGAWPRVPAHAATVVRAGFVSVLSARGAGDAAVAAVARDAAALLGWAAACGRRARFDALVGALRPALGEYASLAPARELDAALRARLEAMGLGDGGGGDAEQPVAGGALARQFIKL